MADFEKAIIKVLENEGGYVNDPDDAGGETNYGITKRFYPDVDIKNITIEKVKQIYKADYWDAVKGDQIKDQRIAFSIFDFGVNAGPIISIRLAQKAAGAFGDGVIGMRTLKNLNSINPDTFLRFFAIEKVKRYLQICEAKPSQKKFFYGWIKRTIKEI